MPMEPGKVDDTRSFLDPKGSVNVGDVIAEKYRIERVLAVGGMGIVVAAEHLELRERVAVKFMLPEALDSAEAVGRFMREARAAVKIKGEHVARVTDMGKLESGAPYIVMEYLEGTDLRALLVEQGPLPIKEAVEYLLQTCEAIAEAHALGIIHRDLKPSNLFLTRRRDGSPFVKVLDFGISKVLRHEGVDEPDDLVKTNTFQVLGSPLYMSPEQITCTRNASVASDIWSLGTILFELLTGSPPFQDSSLSGLRQRILHAPTPSLRQYKPDAPRRLDAVTARCLEKDEAKRYPDIAKLAVDLREFAGQQAQLSVERICSILHSAGLGSKEAFDVPVAKRESAAPARVDSVAPRLDVRGSVKPSAGREGRPSRGGAARGTIVAKVLIIDDDENFCALVRLWLRSTGIGVTFLDGPFGSLNAIRKGGFDLVILDLTMPGINGQEIVRLIRETKGLEQTRILLCSGAEEDRLREIARQVGVQSYLTKSSSKNEFVGAVMAALGKGP